MCIVKNKRKDSNGVYVGRPTIFGNPFEIGKDGTRSEVIEKYKAYIAARPDIQLLARQQLKGQDLVCWCAPLPCHADTLIVIANNGAY